MTKLRHVMIDIETLDILPTAKILSIGVVIFDPRYGKISNDTFYTELNHKAQKDRTTGKSTEAWWAAQPLQIRSVLNGKADLAEQLEELAWFLPSDCKVWGNGPTFDMIILEDACRQLKIDVPWDFWNIRDCRTIKDMFESQRGGFGREVSRANHNALDDALYQAKYVCKYWKRLVGGK